MPGRLKIQADLEKNCRWLREKEVLVRDLPECCPTSQPKVKTCLTKALDQWSRGFWYFEHLNFAYRAAQMQNLMQLDGFDLSNLLLNLNVFHFFLSIGPYLGGKPGQHGFHWKLDTMM